MENENVTPENTKFEINIVDRVNQRLRDGFKVSFENFFDRSWRLFKLTWWQMLIGYIIIRAVTEIVSRVLTPLFMPEIQYDPKDFVNGSSIDWMAIIGFVTKLQSSPMLHLAVLVSSVIAVLVSAPLQAGFLHMCREADTDDGADIGSLFLYFKGPFAGRIIFAGLITVLASSLLSYLFSYIPLVGPVIGMVLHLLMFFLFMFVTPLIIFGNAGLKDAFVLSSRLFLSKIFPIIGFMFLSYLLSLCGLIGCCIGIIVTVGFLWIGVYLVYKDAVGFPEDEIADKEQSDSGHWQQQPPPII